MAMAAGRLEVHVHDAASAEGALPTLPFARDALEGVVGLAPALAVRTVSLPEDVASLDGPEGSKPPFAVEERA